MSDKIGVLIENKDIRKKFSENSHNNLEKFKKVNIMKKWRNLIEELIWELEIQFWIYFLRVCATYW